MRDGRFAGCETARRFSGAGGVLQGSQYRGSVEKVPAGDRGNIARYHEPVTNARLQVNGYMRQMTSGFKNRRFQIFINGGGAEPDSDAQL
jgi:hypothetical protein